MVIPLGLSRRHRKHLYRCAHKQFTYGHNPEALGLIVRCELCGSAGTVSGDAGIRPDWDRRESLLRSLPERIARRAEDA